MKTWVRHSRLRHPPVRCRGCHQLIVLVAEVGWVLDVPGANSYDICEGDRFGNHAPYDGAAMPSGPVPVGAGSGR